MKTKILEIRDVATSWPALCIDMQCVMKMEPGIAATPVQQLEAFIARRYYMEHRCGYPCNGQPNIAITHLDANGDQFSNDPWFWKNPRKTVAHNYIIDHWAELVDGDVIDIEFIIGETTEKKISERFGG